MSRQLRARFLVKNILTPKNTAIAAPLSTAWDLGNQELVRLSVMVPRGHSGLTGIKVLYDNVAIFPFTLPELFLIANGETVGEEIGFEVSHPLTIVTYNTDIFDHRFYLRCTIADLAPAMPSTASVAIVPITAGRS